jgi:hypothetical protein
LGPHYRGSTRSRVHRLNTITNYSAPLNAIIDCGNDDPDLVLGTEDRGGLSRTRTGPNLTAPCLLMPRTDRNLRTLSSPISGAGMSTAERIAWGLLSLTVLIAWLRPTAPQDEKRVGPPQRERAPTHRWLTIIKRGKLPCSSSAQGPIAWTYAAGFRRRRIA